MVYPRSRGVATSWRRFELRPEAALSKGAIMERGKVRGRSRKRKKFRFI